MLLKQFMKWFYFCNYKNLCCVITAIFFFAMMTVTLQYIICYIIRILTYSRNKCVLCPIFRTSFAIQRSFYKFAFSCLKIYSMRNMNYMLNNTRYIAKAHSEYTTTLLTLIIWHRLWFSCILRKVKYFGEKKISKRRFSIMHFKM